ncbi:hypothetical protein DITRI_Ditri16bG0078500 [Diplodiscus trichospermus]
MASNAAVPFWRAAGMTYITYSNICANLVRNCLKEPYKTEALSREKVHFSISKWTDGKPGKPMFLNALGASRVFAQCPGSKQNLENSQVQKIQCECLGWSNKQFLIQLRWTEVGPSGKFIGTHILNLVRPDELFNTSEMCSGIMSWISNLFVLGII